MVFKLLRYDYPEYLVEYFLINTSIRPYRGRGVIVRSWLFPVSAKNSFVGRLMSVRPICGTLCLLPLTLHLFLYFENFFSPIYCPATLVRECSALEININSKQMFVSSTNCITIDPCLTKSPLLYLYYYYFCYYHYCKYSVMLILQHNVQENKLNLCLSISVSLSLSLWERKCLSTRIYKHHQVSCSA